MAASQAQSKTSEPVMYWSENHDVILCREVLFVNPYSTKKGSTQRSSKWENIAQTLNGMENPKFMVDKRSVRDHVGILVKRYKRKNNAEERATGIAPNPPTELDNAVQQIMELDEVADAEQHEIDDVLNKKAESDKSKAEDMRLKAMEKVSGTMKRKLSEENGEVKQKRKRRNGSDTVLYLTNKAEKDHELKEQELKLKKDQLELEVQRQEAATASHAQFQQQQMAMIQAMQNNQKQTQQQQQQSQQQMMNLQVMMMQQVQEQNKATMALIEKLMKN